MKYLLIMMLSLVFGSIEQPALEKDFSINVSEFSGELEGEQEEEEEEILV